MSAWRLAALDLDGTLVDSAPDLCHCLGLVLADAGLERPSLAETRRWVGDGIRVLVGRGLAARLGHPPDEGALEAALEAFGECYRERLFVESRLYPEVPETLEALAGAGLTLGCVTNKPEAFARGLLEQADLAPLLDFVHGGDTFAAKKPDPLPLIRAASRFGVDPARAVMVGDSTNDCEAARAAGFDFVFARYGYAAPDDPDLNDGHAAIDRFSELVRLLSGQQTAKYHSSHNNPRGTS